MTTSEWSPEVVASKAFRSAFLLAVRQIVVQGLNLVGAALLANILTPSEFGFFAIFTFILSFLTVVGGSGLGASLVREVEEPDEHDYSVVFTIQQVVVVAVGLVLSIVAPFIADAYSLGEGSAWLFRLVAVALLFTSLQIVPIVRMERNLAFGRVAAVEICQALAFNVVAVVLAWNGAGATSFAVALVARAVVGAVLASVVSRWRVRVAWDWPRAKKHLAFSLAFQGSLVLSIVKDSISPIFVGLLIGAAQVGYLRWAELVAAYPVIILMVLQRVYLPAFSKMRAFPERLGNFFESVLLATNALIAPVAMLTLVLIEPLTRTVFGAKWLPALPVFFLLWGANILGPSLAPVFGLLNAFGRSKTTLAFTVAITVATWGLGIPFILRWGIVGFGVVNLLIQVSTLIMFRLAKQHVQFNALRVAARPWALAIIVAAAVWPISTRYPPDQLATLLVYFVVPLGLYAGAMALLYPRQAGRVWALVRGVA